jgi:hypothetical protein
MSLAFIRATQKTCTYCKGSGHNKPNCPQALQKRTEIMQHIEMIRYSGIRVEERLLSFFNFIVLRDMCFLMNSMIGLKQNIPLLVRTGTITDSESKMRYKQDRIKILMWLYWYGTKKYAEKQAREHRIVVKTLETVTDLSEFECPICVSVLPAKEKVETGCKHCICKDCLVRCLEHQIDNTDFSIPRCSMCRTNIKELTLSNAHYLEEVTDLTAVM